jgi:hypothetical protein
MESIINIDYQAQVYTVIMEIVAVVIGEGWARLTMSNGTSL